MIKNELLKKILILILGGLIYSVILVTLFYFSYKSGSGLLLSYAPWFIIFGAFIGLFLWWYIFKNFFETILVYLLYVCFGFAFIFLAPFAVDRSLSTFILFYAVEHDGISNKHFSNQYMVDFFDKRFDDAVKGKFLVYEDGVYKPTYRAEAYYYMLYPLGFAAHMLGNYEQFAAEMDSHNEQ